MKAEGRGGGSELGSDLDLDPDPDAWKIQYYGSGSGKLIRILWIRICNTGLCALRTHDKVYMLKKSQGTLKINK